MISMYAQVQESVAYLRAQLGATAPALGLILGSGLGAFADQLTDAVTIEFSDVPHFSSSTAPGHAGRLVCGSCAGVICVAMQGRLHMYEGYSAAYVTLPVRSMIALGARTVIITNAAGGIRESWEPGTLMLIRDHINLMPDHPLRGPNDERLGPRFPDMTRAYALELRQLARRAGERVGVALEEGVYVGSTGPTYETPAEVAMMRTLGADACGMSTVPEVIVARHMGARVLGISCITNKAAGITGEALSHDEVTATANKVRGQFQALLVAILSELGRELGQSAKAEAEDQDEGADVD